LPTGPTNEFNALSLISPAGQLRLMILAESGNSPVANAFTQEADRLGLTPRGRERKEREETRRFAEQMQALREQAARFEKRLDLLEQASAEAFLRNEEERRIAQEELKRIQDRAYEITMPDGRVVKVYRDGNLVRDEDGGIVSREIVGAEDIGTTHPTWSERNEADRHLRELEAERDRILNYRKELETARTKTNGGDLTLQELETLEAEVDKNMPRSVRDRVQTGPGTSPKHEPGETAPGGLLATPFRKATAGDAGGSDPAETAPDITRLYPNPSMPAPR
jgi:hypothetical protein